MSFNVIATEPFERKLKRLAKKYKSLKTDLIDVINELSENPTLGTPVGKNCYKIRIAIASKGKGKSGGARIITYVRIVKSKFSCWTFMTSLNKQTSQTKNFNYSSIS